MKKIGIFIGCLLIIIGCDNNAEKLAKQTAATDSLIVVVSQYQETLELLVNIEEIRVKIGNNEENLAILTSSETRKTDLVKQRIVQQKEAIIETIAECKQDISEYDIAYPDATTQISSLRRHLELVKAWLQQMESRYEVKQPEIAIFNPATVAKPRSTEARPTQTTSQVPTQQEAVVDQPSARTETPAAQPTSSGNDGWYIACSAKELKEKGITEGGSAFKKPTINSEGNDGFTKINIRTTTEINIDSKRASLVSIHPKGSYKIQRVSNKVVIQITNAEEFWKNSKYAVVKTF